MKDGQSSLPEEGIGPEGDGFQVFESLKDGLGTATLFLYACWVIMVFLFMIFLIGTGNVTGNLDTSNAHV